MQPRKIPSRADSSARPSATAPHGNPVYHRLVRRRRSATAPHGNGMAPVGRGINPMPPNGVPLVGGVAAAGGNAVLTTTDLLQQSVGPLLVNHLPWVCTTLSFLRRSYTRPAPVVKMGKKAKAAVAAGFRPRKEFTLFCENGCHYCLFCKFSTYCLCSRTFFFCPS